ncbi:MAG: hypothetical protein HYT36_02030 [Candidatus Staskawiczbacteria bacterium]|nr:hypothetical protein [Candidatus Staskawiczbacteria bacterium]
MKNWLKENWFKVGFLMIIIIFIVGIFYWSEWRPSQVIGECNAEALKKATEVSSNQDSAYEFVYKLCLRRNGL